MGSKTDRELWSASEFVEWLVPGVQADLIEGERFMHALVSLRRADHLNLVHLLLGSYVNLKGLGKLCREVVAVRLSAWNVFLPDLASFSFQQVSPLGESYASEAPPLAGEALIRWTVVAGF